MRIENPFSLLTEAQQTHARNIGARLFAEAVQAGRLPAGVDDLDMLDRAAIFPRGADDARVAQAIVAADAGFYEAMDDAIPARPILDPPAIDPDTAADTEDLSDATIRLDFSEVRAVPGRWRRQMDEWLLVFLDDAAARYKWSAAQFCAAYAGLAGPAEAGRVFIDPPMARAA